MKAKVLRSVVSVLAVFFALVSVTIAAETKVWTVKEVLAQGQSAVNEVRTVEGFATQWEPKKAETTAFFLLKDDYGDVIKVRTSGEKPETNGRYRITGPVGVDTTVVPPELFISEESRVDLWKPGTNVKSEKDLGGSGVTQLPVGLVAAVVVVLLILAGLLTWTFARRRQADTTAVVTATPPPATTGFGPTGAEPVPQKVEGHTIKISVPPEGTLKLLPGRLVVVAGDDTVKEISFYRVKGQSTPEVTFGRVEGPPYTHVQLKKMTVSSRQAKLTYLDNQWVLTNFAPPTSNPTRHNGGDLAVDGQVKLSDGDKIEMGEVKFEFRAK
jgi:hypothetical protein